MLAIIIVNYHSENLTIRYVRNELSKITLPYKVIIVNNESDVTNVQSLRDHLPSDCVILNNSENLGFAKANNLGAEYAIHHFFSKDLDDDWLLITNNDIRFLDSNVTESLINKLRNHPEAGIIGPRIVGKDGKRQGPFPFYSFAEKHLLPFWGKLFLDRSQLGKRLKKGYAENATEGTHYRLMGAFFIARASDWVAVEGFDPSTFLYAEESILSERLKKIGKSVYYDPTVSIIHDHETTTKRFFSEIQRRHIMFNSEAYYYKHYLGTPWILLFAARITYLIRDIKDILFRFFEAKR